MANTCMEKERDIIREQRGEPQKRKKQKEIADFFNPIIRQAFAIAYINAIGKNVSTLKPQEPKK